MWYSPVPHKDVFWYRLNGMSAQKNAPYKIFSNVMPCIFVMRCESWHHLYKLEKVQTPMEEYY